MSRSEAFKKDTSFYAEFDEGSGSYGVFGDNSGFCYETYSDEPAAKDVARRMTDSKKRMIAFKNARGLK